MRNYFNALFMLCPSSSMQDFLVLLTYVPFNANFGMRAVESKMAWA